MVDAFPTLEVDGQRVTEGALSSLLFQKGGFFFCDTGEGRNEPALLELGGEEEGFGGKCVADGIVTDCGGVVGEEYAEAVGGV